ncbi:hypothetical protein [Autumnicola psychrophila]|uniref:Uncharacterized protein n=1 Tax=Autumnicola psychrophila TaxID=3075592 RepID=A0ABU3DVX7_9FLAO|nr:hypothetical protein [Zunongwangia sp. F225]MDT0687835.1 hypothetical protein [Zunongwangia sp. F225]
MKSDLTEYLEKENKRKQSVIEHLEKELRRKGKDLTPEEIEIELKKTRAEKDRLFKLAQEQNIRIEVPVFKPTLKL